MKNIVILICVILLSACKGNTKNPILLQQEKVTNDSIVFNKVNLISSNKDGNIFANDKYRFSYNYENNSFNLFSNNKEIGVLDFQKREYNGPGFQIYQFISSKLSNYVVFIIEATADIGTSWYNAVLIKDNKILSDFIIDEPRTNSEKNTLEQFITIYIQNDTLNFRFNKSFIAPYSIIPNNLRSDNQYFYLKYNIVNEK